MEEIITLDLRRGQMAALQPRPLAAPFWPTLSSISWHLAHPKAADPAYGPALEAMTKSVETLQTAVHAGDAAAGGLKVPYSKLFAKFG